MFRNLASKVSVLVLAATFAQAAFADGKMSMDLQPWRGRFLMDAEKTGDTIKGSISPSRLSPFINLQLKQGKKGAPMWQGMLSQQIASVEVKDKGNGKFEVTIAALPGGWFSYTLVTKANGDIEVNGMGPNGNLNSGGMKKNGNELYFFNMGFSFEFKAGKNGKYNGNVVGGGANSGEAYLTASGDLDPHALMKDPALFILIYILPFSS